MPTLPRQQVGSGVSLRLPVRKTVHPLRHAEMVPVSSTFVSDPKR